MIVMVSLLWFCRDLQPINEYHYAMQGKVFQCSFMDDKADFQKVFVYFQYNFNYCVSIMR